MTGFTVRNLFVLALFLCVAAPAWSADSMPSVSDLLFEQKDLDGLKAGDTLTYRFQRTVSERKSLGAPFSDNILVSIKKVAEEDNLRDVDLQIFTGDRARPVQELPHRTGNPVLVVFLDRVVNNFAAMAGGKTQYLKNRMRVDMRENPKIESAKIKFGGKTIEGYRVTMTPFIKDPNRHKMYGYEGSRFDVLVSDAVPGRIVEMAAVFESPLDGAPRLEERIRLSEDGATKIAEDSKK